MLAEQLPHQGLQLPRLAAKRDASRHLRPPVATAPRRSNTAERNRSRKQPAILGTADNQFAMLSYQVLNN
jgi:hypothetical protein